MAREVVVRSFPPLLASKPVLQFLLDVTLRMDLLISEFSARIAVNAPLNAASQFVWLRI